MVIIYLLYFVRRYWKSITERRALSRFASALLFDDEFLEGQRGGFYRELKAMPATDAGRLVDDAAETVVDLALVFDKGTAAADVQEALMATKAKADSI